MHSSRWLRGWKIVIMHKILVILLMFMVYLNGSRSQVEPPSVHKLVEADKIPASITKWNFIGDIMKFVVLSLGVEHHDDGSWYVPSLHDKYSSGWNRSTTKGFLGRPYACNIRMIGVGLESTLDGFEEGGTGYLVISEANNREIWHGVDKTNNESTKLHCYYMTNKGYGSNFMDKPKTYGIAIHCPVTLDMEAGEYGFRMVMQQGYFCRVLADSISKVQLHLRPSNFVISPLSTVLPKNNPKELVSEFVTTPAALRKTVFKEIMIQHNRPNAVCTVQTFRNQQTGVYFAGTNIKFVDFAPCDIAGIMLFLFASYYYRLGWSVIIYDRFGLHRSYLAKLIDLPGIFYHPYTVYQLAQPSKYNAAYAEKAGSKFKYYYTMEKNWVKSYGGEQADTADQDMDKTRTYDHCRLEYMHMDMILYVDADEFFFCPQAEESLAAQRAYQQQLMSSFSAKGIEEMRFIRIPYAGLAPESFNNTAEERATTDLTNSTHHCMLTAQALANDLEMFKCWSNASTYDDFPKSADLASVCPFHYNHWSCDGMRGGGRDYGKRCRCKVSFDMINDLIYKPVLYKCHIIHFNDNKYRFQLIRPHGQKRKNKNQKQANNHDNGNITTINPIAFMYQNNVDGYNTAKFEKLAQH